jgi:ABC-type polysaccharide/polyol phosphate export permease
MKYTLAEDARPQISLLIIATLVSVGVWVVSWFIPVAAYILYPLQLFATFIHEGGHALAAFVTGNAVQSLTVSPDGSGAVWSQSSGLSSLFISSAGYLGTTAFGVALLAWMRRGYSSRTALASAGVFVGLMTFVFGFLAPFYNFLANVTLGSILFTVFSGTVLAAALLAIAKFASIKWANFALAFLAVQCLLNALFSLRDLFVISATSAHPSDAANMAAATGVPALVWAAAWIAISFVMIMVGIRMYASGRKRLKGETVFID